MNGHDYSADRVAFDHKVVIREITPLTEEYQKRVESSLGRFIKPVPPNLSIEYFFIPGSEITEINITNLVDPSTSPDPLFAIIFSEYVVAKSPDYVLDGTIVHEIAHAERYRHTGNYYHCFHWETDLASAKFVGKNTVLRTLDWLIHELKTREPEFFREFCDKDFVERVARISGAQIP